MTDVNLWKVRKIDVLYWHEVFNIIDEILEKQISLLKPSLDEANEEELINRYLIFPGLIMNRIYSA